MTSNTEGLPPTERRNPRTTRIDQLDTASAIRTMLAEDAAAVNAAEAAADTLAEAADIAAEHLGDGGRLCYFGAGASGRIAMLDATEITPTFGAVPDLFSVCFPGGDAALVDSSQDMEDAVELGERDADAALTVADVAVGISASGTTPYVRGALRRAAAIGAATVLLTMNPSSPLRPHADVIVAADTGPEALTGSTRLKAGTATKVLLNALSTTIMMRLGLTYSNLMVGVTASNDKLRDRAVRILIDATSQPAAVCADVLAASDGDVRLALVQLLSGRPCEEAAAALRRHTGVTAAVTELTGDAPR